MGPESGGSNFLGEETGKRMAKYQHLIFYLRKHGTVGCCRILLKKLWIRIFGQWEWLYVLDLSVKDLPSSKKSQLISLSTYTTAEQLDSASRSALREFKSERALRHFLVQWFSRGAILSVARKGDQVVGVQWTLEGGLNGFYSVPILAGEVVIVAVEVFAPFRGQGIYPLMARELARYLQRAGYRRAYLKVAARNMPMQRSVAKTSFSKIGKVYTRRCCGKSITAWEVRSIAPYKPILSQWNEPVCLPRG